MTTEIIDREAFTSWLASLGEALCGNIHTCPLANFNHSWTWRPTQWTLAFEQWADRWNPAEKGWPIPANIALAFLETLP